MSRTTLFRRIAPALLLAVSLSACSTDESTDTTDGEAVEESTDETADETADEGDAEVAADAATFPVTVTDDAGETTIEAAPEAIVSLSPTATEMLFAVGAGDQVVAVDEFSNFPAEAPTTDLSGFTPNAEAILAYEPDLVVLQSDSNGLVASLTEAGVPVLQLGSATTVETAFSQLEALGAATGNDAESVVAAIQTELDAISADADTDAELTYYHELSSDLYSATSATFIGEIYGLFGLQNIADAADADGFGYPQLSAEYLVEQDPDYVFLACTIFCGESVETFCARDGFADLTACADGNVVELDDDVASRWGPRMVEFAQSVDAALAG